MACFNFRTLLNGQLYGSGFFEYPDALGIAAGTTVYQSSIINFAYKDPEVGSFDISNLNNMQFTIGSTATNSTFNIIMSTPDRLKSVTAGPAQPGLLGITVGKPIKLEWPSHAEEIQTKVDEPSVAPEPAQPNPPMDQPNPLIMELPAGDLLGGDESTPTTVMPAPNPAVTSIPAPYESCISDCFSQMGRETRCFVLETVKVEVTNLINNSNLDLSRLTLVLNEIREALDGDNESEGLQAYVKLINDIKFLMDNRLTQESVVNIISNTKLSNNTVTNLINNELFINNVANNQQIMASFVNNSISKIISYLVTDVDVDAGVKNQFVAALNQLIIKQIAEVKQEINTSINSMREEINNRIQQINIEITNIHNGLKGNPGSYASKLELENLQIQVDSLKEIIKSISFKPDVDLSTNITIVNVQTQISQINKNIADIKINLQRYMTRDDFAYACETACNSFLTALRNPAPCEESHPKLPEEIVSPPPTPIKVKPGASIKGDPHFIGAEGGKYDVQGEIGKTYNLLSDQGVQVNGTFGEWNVDGQGTIIKAVGITHGKNFIQIGLEGALEINGKPVTKDGSHLSGAITKAANDIIFKGGEYELLITDDQVQGHHYLNIEFQSANVVADGVLPHGLWGQTADGDGKARDGDKGHYAQGGGAIEGADGTITKVGDKEAIKVYEVKDLKDTTFRNNNRFSGKATPKKGK